MNNVRFLELKNNYVPTDIVTMDDRFVLFFPNTPFTNKVKNILSSINLPIGFTNGTYLDPKNLVNVGTHALQESTLLVLQLSEADVNYKKYFKKLKKIFSSVGTTQQFVFDEINGFIYQEIIPSIRTNPYSYIMNMHFIDYDDSSQNFDYYIHLCLKNLIFTLATLEISPSRIIPSINRKVQAGICALLMNIGILPINALLIKNNQSTNIQFRHAKVIPIISKMNNNIYKKSFVTKTYSMLNESINNSFLTPNLAPKVEEIMKDIVYYVILTSSYVFITTNSQGHQAYTPYHTLHSLLKTTKNIKIFNQDYLKELTYILGTYPPGSIVELENLSSGIVIKPRQPDQANLSDTTLVLILVNTGGEITSTPTVVSTDKPGLGIKKIIPINETSLIINAKNKLFKELQDI